MQRSGGSLQVPDHLYTVRIGVSLMFSLK